MGTAKTGRAPVKLRLPVVRGDCANVPRPCPYVRCRHHAQSGEKRIVPGADCTLDVADRAAQEGGLEIHEIAEVLGIHKSRVHQVEREALAKLRKLARGERIQRVATFDAKRLGQRTIDSVIHQQRWAHDVIEARKILAVIYEEFSSMPDKAKVRAEGSGDDELDNAVGLRDNDAEKTIDEDAEFLDRMWRAYMRAAPTEEPLAVDEIEEQEAREDREFAAREEARRAADAIESGSSEDHLPSAA